MASLLEQVVAASGVSPIFASRAVRRVCEKAGINPDALTPKQLRELLPALADMMRIYLSGAELERHKSAIAALT